MTREVLRPLVRGPGRLGAWLAAWLIMDDSAATAEEQHKAILGQHKDAASQHAWYRRDWQHVRFAAMLRTHQQMSPGPSVIVLIVLLLTT